jgi:hypothetical protein
MSSQHEAHCILLKDSNENIFELVIWHDVSVGMLFLLPLRFGDLLSCHLYDHHQSSPPCKVGDSPSALSLTTSVDRLS